jgi:thiol-disulfide isomerase/thioredoxin
MSQIDLLASRPRRRLPLGGASLLLGLLASAFAGCGGEAPQSTATSEPAGSTPAATSAPASTPVPATTEAIRLTRTPELLVDVDGKPAADAVVYERQTPPYYLLTSSALPAPVLISARAGSVETVDPAKLTVQPDGTAELAAGAGQKSHGTFTSAADLRMTVDGKLVVLKPAPPLLGLKNAADLKAYSPNYELGARAYRPNGSALTALKGLKDPVVVQIYFGSWCPHCKQEVPKVVRVDEELSGSQVRFEYYGLPSPFSNEPEAKRLKIDAVPTGIVYMAGREVGRIEGSGWSTPEVALRNMLASGPIG